MGTFGEIDVFNKVIPPDFWKSWVDSDVWLSWQRTKGKSDLYIQSNVWQPGGTTGWHSHPGHSLIIITAGTVTDYESDARHCTPHVYSAGMTLVDEGGDHTHIHPQRRRPSIATGYAVQLIPAGATRRIDADRSASAAASERRCIRLRPDDRGMSLSRRSRDPMALSAAARRRRRSCTAARTA